MELTDLISTEEIKEKLQNLKDHMPNKPEFTYDFGTYLATRLEQSEINPLGFNMTVQRVLYDLAKGIDGFTMKPVPSSLSGMPVTYYAAMRTRIPEIARAVCPADFAERVAQVYAETGQF